MAEDIRVILIKLAEKLHALRVLDSLPADVRKSAATECLDVYAPLADRLGISWIKDEMEDLSLKQLNREVYQQIKDIVAEKRGERHEFLLRAQETIRKEAEAAVKKALDIHQKESYLGEAAYDWYLIASVRSTAGNYDAALEALKAKLKTEGHS